MSIDPAIIVKRRDDLQKTLGAFPVCVIEKFQNWGETQVVTVISMKPKTDDVPRVVKAAEDLNLTIRCVGDGHSWSPLFPDEGNILMYVRGFMLDNEKRIRLNQNDLTMTVAPGATVSEVADFFLANNVCLKSNVILGKVMYGGVVATACHGVGKGQMSVSDSLVGMTLVEPNADKRTYNFKELREKGGKDPTFVQALKCNLGLFGVMTDLTLKVEPMVLVKTENEFYKVEDLFYNSSNLKRLWDENWSVEIFWFPFNSMSWPETLLLLKCPFAPLGWNPKEDEVWVRKINIIDGVPDNPCPTTEDYQFRGASGLASTTFGRLLSGAITRNQRLVPAFMKAGFGMVKYFNKDFNVTEPITRAIHYQSFIELFPVVDMEFAFNADVDFEMQAKAMQIAVETCEYYAKELCQFPLSVAMEMRWIASSEALLCPACVSAKGQGGTGNTLYLEVLGIANIPNWTEFAQDVASEWMDLDQEHKPLPHWSKQWSFLHEINPYIQLGYGQNLTTFKSVYSQAETGGRFINKALNEVLYGAKKGKGVVSKAKPKPKPKKQESENVHPDFETYFRLEAVDSWKEFWTSVGEQTWRIPNASPRMNSDREWHMAEGLMKELGLDCLEHLGKKPLDETMIRNIFRD